MANEPPPPGGPDLTPLTASGSILPPIPQHDPWGHPGLHLLAPASLLMRAAVAARNTTQMFKKAERLRAPVISVGNLSVGGTGKTPLVEWLIKWCITHGHKPVVLSRGYGETSGGTTPDDEAFILRHEYPGVVRRADPDRLRAGTSALEDKSRDVVILDDGFQHRRLARDLDLVCLDATVPPSRRHRLLPWGPFREPCSALKRATFVVLTRVDQAPAAQVDAWKQIALEAAGVPVLEATHEPLAWTVWPEGKREAASRWYGKRVLALCAIGNPSAFLRTLDQMDLQIGATAIFRDHHLFTPDELDEAQRRGLSKKCEVLCTTEKDAARLDPRARWILPVAVLRISFTIRTGREILEQRLAGLFARPAAGGAT
ncbi:MAG: tetraacyldisaccharide 4'-kinase [Planctomycetes bacterium]|nr:tetraacyldisaccharide 4'-kinase [Planctomycetota bacterium]